MIHLNKKKIEILKNDLTQPKPMVDLWLLGLPMTPELPTPPEPYDDELLNKLKETINFNDCLVCSENPKDHWNLLFVQNQIVLDLGCGFHMIETGFMNTPEYFLSKGASQVIGVDPSCEDIEILQKKYPKNLFFCDIIDSVPKLERYINFYKITSLKMDIEGEERYLLSSKDNFDTLKYVAIETHNKSLLKDIIANLIKKDFIINSVCTFYPRVYNICNLIYASRE